MKYLTRSGKGDRNKSVCFDQGHHHVLNKAWNANLQSRCARGDRQCALSKRTQQKNPVSVTDNNQGTIPPAGDCDSGWGHGPKTYSFVVAYRPGSPDGCCFNWTRTNHGCYCVLRNTDPATSGRGAGWREPLPVLSRC